MKAIGLGKNKLCNACFTGKYPIDVQIQMASIEAARREPALAAAESLNRAGGA
jgi:glutamine phosphoribosylpyrophosphate amidotransferase